MNRMFSRRAFLGLSLGSVAGIALAEAPSTSLRPQLRPAGLGTPSIPDAEQLVRAAKLSGALQFAVVDVRNGKVLESGGGQTALPPASVAKAITAAYALDALGGAHRFETQLIARGPVKNGVVDGDLVLSGGGDPTLDTDDLADMAAQLKQAGIREVRGRLRVWSGALPFERILDKTQPDHVSYNPAISALTLNYNRVYFEWKRSGQGYAVTMDARSSKYRPDVRSARMSVVSRSGPVFEYSDEGDHDAWSVAQSALGNGGARWLPVRRPGAYAAEVFATFARAQGIVLKPGAALSSAPKGTVLVTHKSPPLTAILKGMLKFSNNLTAELVGISATARRDGTAQSVRASARAMNRWAEQELGLKGAGFLDHSGLSAQSRVSAVGMATAMARLHGKGELKPILKDFALRSRSGQVNVNHPVSVAAKTGTLYFVSSLSGYMTRKGKSDLAFAIFSADAKLRQGYDPSTGQRPRGSRTWNRRAKGLQQSLIERWNGLY